MIWYPTCKRFVAYLDIMGFRDKVYRYTHNEVLDIMERFRIPIKKMKDEAKERLKQQNERWDTFRKTIVRPVMFSDSVLLFSSDDTKGSIRNIIWQVKSVIIHALSIGIPIKGAIAYGEQTANFGKSLYFGKPLIDAWELQNEIVIYGMVLHHTIERYLKEKEWMEELDNRDIIQYPTPLKQGTINHFLVNWLESTNKNDKLVKSLPDIYGTVSGSARQYVDNTMNFVHWIEKKKKAQNKKGGKK